jgi:hypothetical protein
MCCASLLETVTQKNWPELAPLWVNNPHFLCAPYIPIVPGQRTNRKLTHLPWFRLTYAPYGNVLES